MARRLVVAGMWLALVLLASLSSSQSQAAELETIAGRVVYADDGSTAVLRPVWAEADGSRIAATSTDLAGFYNLRVPPGQYRVCGASDSLQGCARGGELVSVRAGAITFVDLALPRRVERTPEPIARSLVQGFVFLDDDADGQADPGEIGVGEAEVGISSPGWAAHTHTAGDGSYSFAGLTQGRFELTTTLPVGHYFTGMTPAPVTLDGTDSQRVDFGIRAWVANDAILTAEYERLGGESALGLPISRPFLYRGHSTQVFARAVLQWDPVIGQAQRLNLLDELHAAGMDEWLATRWSVPRPLETSFDAGKSWPDIMEARLALLAADPAISAYYWGAADPLAEYGLPTSHVVEVGGRRVVRLQRSIILAPSRELETAPSEPVESVDVGVLARESGLFPHVTWVNLGD